MKNMSLLQKRGLRTVVVGYFMVQFALVPIAAMLPSVSKDLSITIAQSGWLMTIYLLSLTGLLLISGRLGDQFGAVRIFKFGVVIFFISSILCGFATTYEQLLIFRGLQGVGTALLSGNSLAIISKLFPEVNGNLRGRAFGTVTSAAAFGSLIGIMVSTVFLQYMSWRWIFWITIPLGIFALGMIKNIKEERPVTNWRKIDFGGAGLLYSFLILLMYYISTFAKSTGQEGMSHGGHAGHGIQSNFMSGTFESIILPILLVLIFLLLIIVEKKASFPIIIFREFKNKLFISSLTTNLILHLSMINVTFFVPFLIENALGMAPIFAGIVLLSVELMNAIFPRISGAVYDRTKSSLIRPLGMLVILSGFIIYYFTMGEQTMTPYLLLGGWIGIGMGIYWSINNNIIMNSITGDYRGFASGMLETTRQLGHTTASAISAVAMSLGAVHVDKFLANGVSHEAASIFAGSQNVMLVSIPLAAIGLALSFFREKKHVVVTNEKVVSK